MSPTSDPQPGPQPIHTPQGPNQPLSPPESHPIPDPPHPREPHVSPLRRGSSQSPQPQRQLYDRLFLLAMLAAIAYVLWLPVFPTGDGPVHLYYADVLWSLVNHQPTYAHDYAIRHLFAPYLVHYLALVSFEHFVPPPLAEKLFIALIFLTQALGFRFLARTLGREASGARIQTACLPRNEAPFAHPPEDAAPVACLWMLPLLFSWSLGGGFLNCCFATGVALWSYGVWTQLGPAHPADLRPNRTATLLLAFALTLIVLVLSHPVPLLVLLLFTASDLLLQTLARPARWQPLAPQAAAFTITCAAFVAPVLLAQKGQAAAVLPGIGFHADVLRELVLGMRLGLFAGLNTHTPAGWLALITRAGLIAIVPGVAFLLFPQKSATNQTRQTCPQAAHPVWPLTLLTSPAHRLLLISLIFLAATIFFPRSLNHSYFFPQRLWDIVWLLVLASGAAATPSPRTRHRLAAAALVLIALTAITGLPALARIARAQQQLAAAPLPPGKRGLFLEPDSAQDGHHAATTYPVYFWAGARAFAASHAILLNSPWLGLTILPIRDAAAPGPRPLLDIGLPSIYSESPLILTRTLASPSPARTAILARADFLLYTNPASLASPNPAELTLQAALALLGPESAAWHCTAPGFYAICVQQR